MTDYEPALHSDGGAEADMAISAVLDSLLDEFPDVSVSKIRFLESRGLITPERAPSGYRKFSDADVDRLRWILTMQRDYFLPLRVIKERLEAGEDQSVDAETGQAPAPRNDLPARSASTRFRAPGPDSESLDAADVARLAGISAAQLDELVKFGILDVDDSAEGDRYTRDQLRVAKAAGAFIQRGIEARHLKAWRVAAEREAGLLEQIVIPLSRQNTADAPARAREIADDLIDMGTTIREAIIVKALRRSLGDTGD